MSLLLLQTLCALFSAFVKYHYPCVDWSTNDCIAQVVGALFVKCFIPGKEKSLLMEATLCYMGIFNIVRGETKTVLVRNDWACF